MLELILTRFFFKGYVYHIDDMVAVRISREADMIAARISS